MLSHLDRIIFADRCEVVEVIPSQRYVYPIFKNGSTTLLLSAKKHGWKIKFNEQICKIETIDVVIREPDERLKSGINTFIKTVVRDNINLDIKTVEWFALNYLYLNNHYCPQFLWLINLSRFMAPTAKLNFIGMNDIHSITDAVENPGFGNPSDELIAKVNLIKNKEMYQRIDNVLFDSIGTSMTFGELWQHIKNIDPIAYEYVFEHAHNLLKTTHVLP
jgi:hypothetical protein